MPAVCQGPQKTGLLFPDCEQVILSKAATFTGGKQNGQGQELRWQGGICQKPQKLFQSTAHTRAELRIASYRVVVVIILV